MGWNQPGGWKQENGWYRPAASGVGPPSFTHQGDVTNTGSGSTITYSSLPVGSASANRFVAIMVNQYVAGGTQALSATINGSAVGVTVTPLGANIDVSMDLITAQVSSGTTINLVVNYSVSTGSGLNSASSFTTDVTTMSSTTPIVSTMSQVTSAVSQTKTINIATNGTAVLALFAGFGITSGTQVFTTPNDPSVAQDLQITASVIGHANNALANAASRVSVAWSGSGDGNMALVGFR